MTDKLNILVLCTGNSCRSQMAEGFLRELASDRFKGLSGFLCQRVWVRYLLRAPGIRSS